DPAGGVWRAARDAVPEPAPAAVPSAPEEPPLLPGDARQVFRGHRVRRSEVFRGRSPQAAGGEPQPAHRAGGGMMRYFLAILALCVLATVGVLGLRGSHSRRPPLYIFPDMERQPKLRPQTANAFFDDSMSSRLPVAGTIARSQPIQLGDKSVYPWKDTPVTTGRVTGTTNFVELNPLPVTAEVLQRGEEVFNIVCAACHSKLGDGNGTPKRINAMVTVGNL